MVQEDVIAKAITPAGFCAPITLARLRPPMDHAPRHSITSARDIVVKLGTQLLSDGSGAIDAAFLRSIADQVAALKARNARVTHVSSGAIGSGLRELNLNKRPTDLARLQAIAAVGQRRLMDAWADAFEPHK